MRSRHPQPRATPPQGGGPARGPARPGAPPCHARGPSKQMSPRSAWPAFGRPSSKSLILLLARQLISISGRALCCRPGLYAHCTVHCIPHARTVLCRGKRDDADSATTDATTAVASRSRCDGAMAGCSRTAGRWPGPAAWHHDLDQLGMLWSEGRAGQSRRRSG